MGNRVTQSQLSNAFWKEGLDDRLRIRPTGVSE